MAVEHVLMSEEVFDVVDSNSNDDVMTVML